ncbi:MAG: DegV family protein [Erysipelotrichaceae bacterium]|nr:DegV family protein [Erysipelotrichaceae bacterium]
MKIKIIADSSCDLSPEIIKKYDIEVLPLHIIIDNKSYDDGVDITPDDIFRWCDEHKACPGTAGLSPYELGEAYKKYLMTYDYILCFSVASTLSGTYNMMRATARDLNMIDKVYCINSKNLCSAIGLQILKAKELIAKGKDIEYVYKKVRDLRSKISSSFVVDTLDYLNRGGRCSDTVRLMGTALKIHPKIVVEDGNMRVAKKYRGNMKRVRSEYVADLHESLKKADKERIFVSYSGEYIGYIDEVKEMLLKEYRFKEVLVTRAGCVISSHCGPGTFALFFAEK